jgi:hypothetical protein
MNLGIKVMLGPAGSDPQMHVALPLRVLEIDVPSIYSSHGIGVSAHPTPADDFRVETALLIKRLNSRTAARY